MVKALIKAAIGDDMDEDDDEEGVPSSRNMRDTTMANDDTKEITMKLGAAEAKLADTTTRLSAVESEVVALPRRQGGSLERRSRSPRRSRA